MMQIIPNLKETAVKRKTRRVLIALLSLVFAGSLGMLVYCVMDCREGEETYAEAETLVDLPDFSDLPPPVTEEAAPAPETEKPDAPDAPEKPGPVRLQHHRLRAPDEQRLYVCAFEELLEAELLGCPFLRVHHRQQRQSQVGDLRRLRGLHRRDTYHLGFPKDSSNQAFIDYCLEQSVIDSGITLTVYDRVLTLSTCTGNGHATRWVDQAVLKCVAPSDAAQKAPAEPEQQPETEPAPA